MFNRVFRLVSPRQFEPVETIVEPTRQTVLVRPTYLSICNADQRYYQGTRSAEALAKKLPMALIHEGIGVVCSDPTATFATGQRVIMLPNAPVESDPIVAENYLRSSKFCGSGTDGFMQEYMALPASRVLALPDSVPNQIAAFTEIVSVTTHAIARFDAIAHARRETIGVWGDGNVGFLVALQLSIRYPDSRVVVVGRSPFKLDAFTFANMTVMSDDDAAIPAVDHAFECCGGDGSTPAISQIIDHINPEGTISLLGVSENPVPINTRMVLEKGLRLFGSSRSGRQDFVRTLDLYRDNPQVINYLDALVNSVNVVRDVVDVAQAFEADTHKTMGKTVIEWDI